MVHIGRTIGPLIGTRQGRSSVVFMKTVARNRGMLQIGSECFKSRRDAIPIVERGLQRAANMRGIGVPCEVVRDDNKAAITAGFQ